MLYLYLPGDFDDRFKWSETDPGFIFDFLIHDQFNQQIQVDVYDKDADWDDHLGGFTIDIISGRHLTYSLMQSLIVEESLSYQQFPE